MSNIYTNYRGVQALRGLAALSVMLFHFRWSINEVTPALGDKLFGWGANGVDLFFLISGFVITLSASKAQSGISGALNFIKKRALRILPAYYFILMISFLLSGAMSIFHYPDKTENLISALSFMPIYPHHAPFYVDDSGLYGVRWTLNYEVYFYLSVGLMIIFGYKWLCAALFFAATLFIMPICIWGSFTLSPSGYESESPLLGLITNPMIFLFLLGVMLGLLLPYINGIPPKLMAVASLVILVIAVMFFSLGMFVEHGVLSSGWIYALLLTTVVLSEKFIANYVPAFLVRLGDISFSLYLVHGLLNAGLGKRLDSIGIEGGYERFFVSLLASLLLAWLSWRYIEKPFATKKIKKELV